MKWIFSAGLLMHVKTALCLGRTNITSFSWFVLLLVKTCKPLLTNHFRRNFVPKDCKLNDASNEVKWIVDMFYIKSGR